MSLIYRQIEKDIIELSRKFPIIVITGARQTGKTTLAKKLFPDYTYVNFEDLELREYAQNDPKDFLSYYNNRVIFDEIQHVPGLFSYLQVEVEKQKLPGRFILTGSQNFLLIEKISQSLAGRAAIFELMPFTYIELKNAGVEYKNYEEYLINGFYPPLYSMNLRPAQWFPNYIMTYLERDLRSTINLGDLLKFKQFLQLLATSIGQTISYSSLGNTLGISYHTAQRWLSILQASYIVFLLPPYFKNLRKRIIKSPKLYFYDIGMAAYLLGIKEKEQIINHIVKGPLFENFIIAEVMKNNIYTKKHNLYFYRDSSKNEIDLIIEQADSTNVIEIKSAKTFNTDFLKILLRADNLLYTSTEKLLIYGGELDMKRNEIQVISWKSFLENL